MALLNVRQATAIQRVLTHAHEGSSLLIFLPKRNYDPWHRDSRNQENWITKQCKIKSISREKQQIDGKVVKELIVGKKLS